MYGFIGTPYFPEIVEGDILLVEDCLKNAAVVEKNFAMLKLHGVFNKVSGIILGKHECYNDLGTGRQPYDILLEQSGWNRDSYISRGGYLSYTPYASDSDRQTSKARCHS